MLTPLHRLAAALTYRDFRVLWIGAFTSSIGTWMQKVAQNWLVLTLTGTSSAFYLGLDSFLGEAPILLFTLVGGVIADRRDRRQLLLMSQYIQMGAAFTLAALVYWGQVQIWHVLTLSVITGVAQAFGGPAYQSLIPSLIDKAHLPNAIALNSIQFNLARGVGRYTQLMAFAGAGAVTGALSVAWLGKFRHMGWAVLAIQMSLGCLIVLFALTRLLLLNELLLFTAGACMMMVFATLSSLVQLIAPNEMRGRVMSIYMVAFRGGMPLGSLVSGWIASITSAPTVLTVNGILLSCVAAWFLLKSHGVREL